jgi:hypothetical protein
MALSNAGEAQQGNGNRSKSLCSRVGNVGNDLQDYTVSHYVISASAAMGTSNLKSLSEVKITSEAEIQI